LFRRAWYPVFIQPNALLWRSCDEKYYLREFMLRVDETKKTSLAE
jgi:hypothetical protein